MKIQAKIEKILLQVYSAHQEPHSCNAVIRGGREAIVKTISKDIDKLFEEVYHVAYKLTQSHDCDNDTACEFEDRAFKMLEDMGKTYRKVTKKLGYKI